MKIKVTEAHKWHIDGTMINTNPKLGGEVIDKYFTETVVEQPVEEIKNASDKTSSASQEAEINNNNTTNNVVETGPKEDANQSNTFLFVGALFLVLGFITLKLFD